MDKNKKIGIGVGAVLLVAVLVLGYLGFVPGLSDLMGANKGRDLGISYTDADYDSAKRKLGFDLGLNPVETPPEDSYKLSDFKPVSTTLTSEELTALMNELTDSWKYFPLDNIQVKINSDNTMEIQSTLLLDRFDGFAKAVKLNDSVVSKINAVISVIKTNPSFYMKGKFTINNGVTESNITQIQIGKVDIPASQLPEIDASVNSLVDRVIQEPVGILKNLSCENSLLKIDGNFPSSISLAPP
jgi:hypothetical protein